MEKRDLFSLFFSPFIRIAWEASYGDNSTAFCPGYPAGLVLYDRKVLSLRLPPNIAQAEDNESQNSHQGRKEENDMAICQIP